MATDTRETQLWLDAADRVRADDSEYWALIDDLVEAPETAIRHVGLLFESADTDRRRALVADLLGRLAERRAGSVPPEAGTHLVEWLRQASSSDTLAAALAAVRRLKLSGALDEVIAAAGHPDAVVRAQAAQTLAPALADSAEASRAVDTLLQLAHDPDAVVREWAAYALASMPDPRVDQRIEETLRGQLNDPSAAVRCEALRGLSRIGDHRALASALSECDPDRELIELALEAGQDDRIHAALNVLSARAWIGDRDLLRQAIETTRPSPASAPPAESVAFYVYIDESGRFRWRLRKPNGRVVAESAESYRDRNEIRDALATLEARIPGAVIAEHHSERRVVPNPLGGWDIIGGGRRSGEYYARQRDAIARARELVSGRGGEVIVYGRDGRIRDRNTVPRRPVSPRERDSRS